MNLSSRVCPLNSFQNVWIKREDELSFGVSGSKLRKLSSFIANYIKNPLKMVYVFGGGHSNSLLATAQLFRENQIKFRILLKKPREISGNYKLLLQIVNQEEFIFFSSKDQGLSEESIIQKYLNIIVNENEILREGANHYWSYEGASLLSEDLIKNETEKNIKFQDIFLDSGTGITASSFISHQIYLDQIKFRTYHICLIAGNEIDFLNSLEIVYRSLYNKNIKDVEIEINFYYPDQAKSFGSTNNKIWKTIKNFARKEGIFLDPIYTAKSYLILEKNISLIEPTHKILFIHSGGGLSLTGFMDKLLID